MVVWERETAVSPNGNNNSKCPNCGNTTRSRGDPSQTPFNGEVNPCVVVITGGAVGRISTLSYQSKTLNIIRIYNVLLNPILQIAICKFIISPTLIQETQLFEKVANT